MVWSEQVGTSIVLPSDRVDGDGRNYIVIGEDVPTEIADQFTAALVFRSGVYSGSGPTPDGVLAGFIFYALGITTSGNFEVVSYFFTTGSPMSNIYYKYRSTVLSIAAPKSVSSQPGFPNGPVLALGTNADYDSYTEGSAATVLVTNEHVDSWSVDSYAANWGRFSDLSYADPGAFIDSSGCVTLNGLVTWKGSTTLTANSTIMTLPSAYCPVKRSIFSVMSSSGAIRVDVLPSGAVATVGPISPGIVANGAGYVTLNGISFFAGKNVG